MATSTVFGALVIVKRNGQDGSRFPLKTTQCVIGRGADSDVRIQVPQVSQKHCRIDVQEDGHIVLVNLSKRNPTQLNGVPLVTSAIVTHGSVFSVVDRSFRWEFPMTSPFRKPLGDASISNVTTSSSSQNSHPDESSGAKPIIPGGDSCVEASSPADEDVENADSSATPLKRGRPSKSKNGTLSSKSSTQRTPVSKDRLSLRKVSFGPNLSPEQFHQRLPSTTPLKKSGRPPPRRSSIPDYYGNPILSPMTIVSRDSSHSGSKDRCSSNDSLKTPSPKNVSFKENASSSIVKLKKKKMAKLGAKSASPKGSNLVRLPSKSRAMSATTSKSKGKGIRILLGLDNAVKIVAPSSLDSKKSAALRTIHAGKLKLKKSAPRGGRRNSTPLKTLKIQIPFKSKSDPKILKSGSSVPLPKRGRPSTSLSPPSVTVASPDWPDGLPDDSPNVPTEMFVSPLCTPGISSVKKKKTTTTSHSAVLKRFCRGNAKTRRSSLNMSGMVRLLQTPSTCTDNILKSRTSNRSPNSDYTNVDGLKRLFKSPRKSPKSDYSDVYGLKRLLKSPVRSPKANYTNVAGVKRLLRNPRAKSPKSEYLDVFGLKRLMRSSQQKAPLSQYTDVHGLKRLMKTPAKSPKSNYVDHVDGIAELFDHGQQLSSPSPNGKRRSSSSAELADVVTAKKAKMSAEKTRVETTTPASRTPRLRLSKSPPSTKSNYISKTNQGLSSSPSAAAATTLTSRLRGRQPRQQKTKQQTPSSVSPKFTARTLRSSARKRATVSPKTPSMAKVSPFPVRSSARKTRATNNVRVNDAAPAPNSPRRRSPSKSPLTQPPAVTSTRRKRKEKIEQEHEEETASKSKAEKTTKKTKTVVTKTKKSLKMAASPTATTPLKYGDDSFKDAATPSRKTRSAKKVAKAAEITEVKSPKSPVSRVTRGSRRKAFEKPSATPSPKSVPKARTTKKVVATKASPEIVPSPKRRVLRSRAK